MEWPACGSDKIFTWRACARHVKTRSTASPIAGTIVQAISLARLGIRIDADSVDPDMGARIADQMSATCARAQQAVATQKIVDVREGDIA